MVYGWNTYQNVINRIANSLGFLGYASWDKIVYLGLPLTLGSNQTSLWNDVMNKLRTKIKAWGGQWLNRVGKLILIKAIISSLSIFQASFLLAPNSIMDQFSKLIKDFLRQGGKGNYRKFHLVKWDKVKLPLTEGSL